MIYTPLTKKAMNICYSAHAGQVDKGGVPYVFHSIHLAEQMDNEYEICLALLHDVVEDTDYTFSDIESQDFPDDIITALKLITRDKGQPYLEYMETLSHNALARKVKLCDLLHNSDTSRLLSVDENAERRLQRYQESIAILTDAKDD